MGEITVSEKAGNFELLVPEKLFKQLGLKPDASYGLSRATDGIWVLVESKENPLDKKIFSKLQESDLKERVEGIFEKGLSKEEMPRFKEMLKEGSIVAFKLSPKYKRAVYKTKEEIDKNIKIAKGQEKPDSQKEKQDANPSMGQEKPDSQKEKQDANPSMGQEKPGKELPKRAANPKKGPEATNSKERPLEEYCIEKDGFLVCKNTARAKQLSQEMKKDIENGNIRGVKGFDGFFYIARNSLYQKHRNKLLSAIKAEKGISSEKVAEKIGTSKIIAKIVCELLKDEGEIIEKRKNQFQAI